MTHESLVSIITPCYNHGRYLPEAVASIVAQTYPHWELLIVDDGSTDDSAAVAERLIAQHPHHAMRLLRQSNSGLSASRNAGLAQARGVYTLPLDADDQIEPEMLAAAVAVLDTRPEVGFVYTDVQMIGAETTRWSGGDYSRTKLRFDNPMIPATLFRTQVGRAVGGFRVGQEYEDWDFWLSLAEAGWQGYHIPRTLVRYRRTNGSFLARSRQRDLELRAQVVRNHPRLYEPGFVAWAQRVGSPAYSQDERLRNRRLWLRAFAEYVALTALYHPRLAPKTLARPLFIRLNARQQGYARRLARTLRMTQAAFRPADSSQ